MTAAAWAAAAAWTAAGVLALGKGEAEAAGISITVDNPMKKKIRFQLNILILKSCIVFTDVDK